MALGFLDLPLEIRQEIYDYALVRDKDEGHGTLRKSGYW